MEQEAWAYDRGPRAEGGEGWASICCCGNTPVSHIYRYNSFSITDKYFLLLSYLFPP